MTSFGISNLGQPGDDFPSKPGRKWGMGSRFTTLDGKSYLVIGARALSSRPAMESSNENSEFQISLSFWIRDDAGLNRAKRFLDVRSSEIDRWVQLGSWKVSSAK